MAIDFSAGDTIRVHQKIKEGEKSRLQVFEGTVLYVDNNAKSFCVRKISDGVGVERIWSFETPWIEKIEVKKHAKRVRRAKLFYLRDLTPKQVAKVVA